MKCICRLNLKYKLSSVRIEVLESSVEENDLEDTPLDELILKARVLVDNYDPDHSNASLIFKVFDQINKLEGMYTETGVSNVRKRKPDPDPKKLPRKKKKRAARPIPTSYSKIKVSDISNIQKELAEVVSHRSFKRRILSKSKDVRECFRRCFFPSAQELAVTSKKFLAELSKDFNLSKSDMDKFKCRVRVVKNRYYQQKSKAKAKAKTKASIA